MEVTEISLVSLWLPIVVSAVVVWIASAIVWMALPHHKPDFRRLPDEAAVREALGKQKAGPGIYMIPYCEGGKGMADPDMMKKFEEGPVGFLTLKKPGKPAMGGAMAYSFLFNLVVAFFVAYVAHFTLQAGTPYLTVFRLTATVGFLSYSAGLMYRSIWFGHPWGATWKEVIDGLVYGLLTGGVFGWLWP
jgi:hypothetical protein